MRNAKKLEAKLPEDYKLWLENKGHNLSVLRRIRCDAWENEKKILIEAKASIFIQDIGMAVGQLFHYAFQGNLKQSHKAILLPDKPAPDYIKWLESLGINIIWRSGRLFQDNVNGQFT